jgi:uncharacterized protein YciI
MDFFIYSTDAPTARELRLDAQLLEEHWSYMDQFAESMIARGPTLGDDLDTATGSLHVLGLPSVAAAREFVEREPNNRAGLYTEHSLWRFDNLLGRTMWEFSGPTDEPKLLIIARAPRRAEALSAELRDRLILYGDLSTLEDDRPVGFALALHAPDRNAAQALLDGFPQLEIHNWEFGGRR